MAKKTIQVKHVKTNAKAYIEKCAPVALDPTSLIVISFS